LIYVFKLFFNVVEGIVKLPFELYDKTKFDLIVEPSAGNGSFFNQLEFENKVGIDISPENENIVKMDYFDYHKVRFLNLIHLL
jgi:hypothetical protein